MPALLPRLEERFERVIVLPSSFDTSVPEVSEVLSRTQAMVFARERESYRQISKLCRASLACDCSFFFGFSGYRRMGSGTLEAFRTDAESVHQRPPQGNRDISLTCSSLDEWLWTIARHDEVRTDRAHVMIAAAMLGKRVFFRPSSYHKVPAIAEYSLRCLPVRPIDSVWSQE